MATNTSVLIVGGSLNGLTAALLLAHRKVPCLVVERHPRTSLQYKFRGISPRSMEIYRNLGIEGEIRACDVVDESAAIARMKNLADSKVSWHEIPWSEAGDVSPTSPAVCDQDQLEPILRAHAERLGAEVRFNTELVDFKQDEQGITACIRSGVSERGETVRASYLIAADGTAGTMRQTLGIKRHGPGVLQHWMNVIFDADLKTTLEGRAIRSVFVTDINGTFVPRDRGRWLMAVQYVPGQGQRPEDFTDEYCLELIRRGAGRPDLKVQIVDTRPWDAAAEVADVFAVGRAFLVGDTAHVMPPTGGFGGNTGIHDVHNLAWKLDAVLRGAAGPRLLDTYDEERRPVVEATMAQSLTRLQAWFKDPSKRLPPPGRIIDDDWVIFGYRYRAGALVNKTEDAAGQVFENPHEPSGLPGSRAAHMVVVERGGELVSTIDLFSGQWVLLAGPKGGAWTAAGRSDLARVFALHCYRVGPDADLREADNHWETAYGVSAEGAVLIRPDGFIAWRARDSKVDPVTALREALEHLSFRD
jgi:putative polyketide hydroxylase